MSLLDEIKTIFRSFCRAIIVVYVTIGAGSKFQNGQFKIFQFITFKALKIHFIKPQISK